MSKYIVPIHPAYHDQMFPEVNRCSLLFTPDNGCLFAGEANAIKKAYICKSGIKRIKEGDILRVRTEKEKIITYTKKFI